MTFSGMEVAAIVLAVSMVFLGLLWTLDSWRSRIHLAELAKLQEESKRLWREFNEMHDEVMSRMAEREAREELAELDARADALGAEEDPSRRS